jgi:hypothetical protein
MMTPYERLRRGEPTALLPFGQALRAGRYPTIEEFAALAIEGGGGKSDAVRAECLAYEQALRADGIDPFTGRPEDGFERFMDSLKFKLPG